MPHRYVPPLPKATLHHLVIAGASLLWSCHSGLPSKPAAAAPCSAGTQKVESTSVPSTSVPSASAVPIVATPQPSTPPRCGLPAGLHLPEMPTFLPSTFEGEREPPPAGSVTLAVLPDTQYYSLCKYAHLAHQAEFIAQEQSQRNILAAITLGDLTDSNSEPEWQFFRESVKPIATKLPLLLTTGNHDLGLYGSSDSRSSGLKTYFPEAFASKTGALRAVKDPGSLENAFYSLDTGKVRLGVLMLEFGPRASTVKWADQVLTRFADHRVIIATHAYLYYDGTRYDYATRPDQKWSPIEYRTNVGEFGKDPTHDGEMLWNALVRKHPGVFLVLSGHVLGQGSGRLTSRGDAGNVVQQVLVNYQVLDEGGLGYLRLVELSPDGKSMHMKTYSPSLKLFSYAGDQDFRLEIDPPLFKT